MCARYVFSDRCLILVGQLSRIRRNTCVVTVSLFPVQENSPALGRGIKLSPGSSLGDSVSAVNPWWILGEGEHMKVEDDDAGESCCTLWFWWLSAYQTHCGAWFK